ncbi:unnamed protein product [Gongylonema pulchrum]|uniref:Mediator of RNA polymerase II transcription subunit 23 n=1 Tax=Gongylonema pulchrum TaxID=637853 RepID=A0A183DC27_9BILA|nr:unnamed protein product [Gongylonema pulchrum]
MIMQSNVYSILADLVHHIREHLSYDYLCCSAYTFTKTMFDPAVTPTVQAMCIKVSMNLIDSFITAERNHAQHPCRDILFNLLANFVRKLKWLARYHIPLIIRQNEHSVVNSSLMVGGDRTRYIFSYHFIP